MEMGRETKKIPFGDSPYHTVFVPIWGLTFTSATVSIPPPKTNGNSWRTLPLYKTSRWITFLEDPTYLGKITVGFRKKIARNST
jgi:hypothetical protein